MEKTSECPLCKLNAEREYSYLKEFLHWHVRVAPCQHMLGAMIISTKRHTVGLSTVTRDELLELHEIQKELERALTALFQPDRFNYIQMGNVVTHLHLHLVPRYAKPRAFAGKTWEDRAFVETPGQAPPLKQEKDEETIIAELREVTFRSLA